MTALKLVKILQFYSTILIAKIIMTGKYFLKFVKILQFYSTILIANNDCKYFPTMLAQGGGHCHSISSDVGVDLPMNLRLSGESWVQPLRLRCPSRGLYLWKTLRMDLSVTLSRAGEPEGGAQGGWGTRRVGHREDKQTPGREKRRHLHQLHVHRPL